MRLLGLPTDRLAGAGPVVVRLVVGVIMAAHGLQKLNLGPERFGSTTLASLGVPLPHVMAYVVTFTELAGGILLIAGLLSRLAAFALLVDLTTAMTLVKSHVGLIAPPGRGAGAELELALIAGFLTILLVGPGRVSLDHLLRVESTPRQQSAAPGPALSGDRI
ncbi:MAG TPA: DoxX family protein [Candidatus Dormibacteraeota bacterium]|jgi:putative oxidoreductase